MLDGKNIRNSAMLKPQTTRQGERCSEVRSTGKHADVKLPDGSRQCVGCGSVKPPRQHIERQTTLRHTARRGR